MSVEQIVYNQEYQRHRDNGDDPMNARLRLLEQGASLEEAQTAQTAANESDDSDDEEF